MLLLRLVQSRSQAGSFYVKDVTDETIASVSKSVGLDDIQASQTTLSYSHTHKSMDNCCVASASYHVHGLDQTIVCVSFLGH